MTYLTTAEAARYLRYKTAAAVRQLKARGRLLPVGRRGKTDLYDRAALDAFVLGSAVERTDDTHGTENTATSKTACGDSGKGEYSHGFMDRRMEEDEVSRHLGEGIVNPNQGADDVPKNRKASRSEPRIRRVVVTRGASKATRALDGANSGIKGGTADALRELRDFALQAKGSRR
jgi:hypothetical protein